MFFPVYLGGYGSNNGLNGTKHYNAVGGSTKNYIPTTGWKYSVGKQDSSQNNSKLTNGSFDISDGNLSGITSTNSTSFLGVKYKNGMTLINNAFLDGGTDTRFNQSALHVHHINFREHGGKNNIENLSVLCSNCHNTLHNYFYDNNILKKNTVIQSDSFLLNFYNIKNIKQMITTTSQKNNFVIQ
jgi:hypothetical protein